jgi:3',5'-cyclic AMP phosphodiesterase CpdA
MRRIAHISDLHFGTEDPVVAAGLLADIGRQDPHLIVVSGDLTQRARVHEFREARTFLDRMTAPKVIVPGNHDVPLYNVVARLFHPLKRYRRIVTPDMHPCFQDEELMVAGVNTARSTTWKNGRISLAQIQGLKAKFEAAPQDHFKVLVSHHPFIPPAKDADAALVGRARAALKVLEACGCSLILAGHLHHAYNGDVRPHHLEIKRSILVAQAGTAISHRRRNEANAYNHITLDGNLLNLEVRMWDGRQFASTGITTYEKSDAGWVGVAP